MENSLRPEVHYVDPKPKRNKYVFISSLILTIFGVITLLVAVMVNFIADVDFISEIGIDIDGMVMVALLNPDLYFGIFGLLSARKPSRAVIIIIMGIISVGIYGYAMLQAMDPRAILGLLIRAFYLYGGINMKMTQPRKEVL